MTEYRNEIRWTLIVVVLAGLAIFALWPRGPATDSGAPAPPAAGRPADAGERAAAALPPCPEGPDAGPSELAGITVTCEADGTEVPLGRVVAGRPTLINVWATWCGPCRAELPALQAYARWPNAVQVVGVQVLSDESGGLELLRELGVRLPVVHDEQNRIRAALRSPDVLPMSYVVTGDGRIRRIDPPVPFESPHEVDAAVRRTLGGASG